VEQYLELNRRFAEGFAATQDDPKVKELVNQVKDYNGKLQRFGLKDRQVEREDFGDIAMLWILLARVVYFVLLMLLAFPGLVLNLPIGGIAKLLAVREAVKSRKASDVKIAGRDVIASYKVRILLLFLLLLETFTLPSSFRLTMVISSRSSLAWFWYLVCISSTG
jgi:glycerol-3-phosphate O-acyltransferase/dihydroxyacetone phosphate acyltransferase